MTYTIKLILMSKFNFNQLIFDLDVNETIGEIPELTELVLDGIKLAGTNRSAIVNLFNAITFLQNSNAKVVINISNP